MLAESWYEIVSMSNDINISHYVTYTQSSTVYQIVIFIFISCTEILLRKYASCKEYYLESMPNCTLIFGFSVGTRLVGEIRVVSTGCCVLEAFYCF